MRSPESASTPGLRNTEACSPLNPEPPIEHAYGRHDVRVNFPFQDDLAIPEFAARHPEIPWGGAYGMGNAIAHGYFAVDLDVVWNTVGEDLPALAEQVGALRVALRKGPRTGD